MSAGDLHRGGVADDGDLEPTRGCSRPRDEALPDRSSIALRVAGESTRREARVAPTREHVAGRAEERLFGRGRAPAGSASARGDAEGAVLVELEQRVLAVGGSASRARAFTTTPGELTILA